MRSNSRIKVGYCSVALRSRLKRIECTWKLVKLLNHSNYGTTEYVRSCVLTRFYSFSHQKRISKQCLTVRFSSHLFSFYPVGSVCSFLSLKTSKVPFSSQDLISSSLYCLPYSSYDVRSENLVLDQLIIPLMIFFFILITYLLDIVLIL